MEKTLEKKGAGVHLDIVLLSLLNMGSGVVGGPWVCAATVSKANCLSGLCIMLNACSPDPQVRAVSHVSALTVMSTANVPGEAPRYTAETKGLQQSDPCVLMKYLDILKYLVS